MPERNDAKKSFAHAHTQKERNKNKKSKIVFCLFSYISRVSWAKPFFVSALLSALSCKINRMKFFAVLLLPFYFLLAIACRPAAAPVSIGNKPVSINEIPVTNQPLPPTKPLEEMTWTSIDGKTNADGNASKLKSLQGKVVILDFWATYCLPCLEEIPHLKELQKKYGRENLEIVGLHVGGDDDRPKVPAFVKKLEIDYPLATPENELTRFIFGESDSIPQTAVFDRKGKLVKKITGFSPEIKRELDATIEKTVNDK